MIKKNILVGMGILSAISCTQKSGSREVKSSSVMSAGREKSSNGQNKSRHDRTIDNNRGLANFNPLKFSYNQSDVLNNLSIFEKRGWTYNSIDENGNLYEVSKKNLEDPLIFRSIIVVPSKDDGPMNLAANEDIEKGAKIGQYLGTMISEKELKKISNEKDQSILNLGNGSYLITSAQKANPIDCIRKCIKKNEKKFVNCELKIEEGCVNLYTLKKISKGSNLYIEVQDFVYKPNNDLDDSDKEEVEKTKSYKKIISKSKNKKNSLKYPIVENKILPKEIFSEEEAKERNSKRLKDDSSEKSEKIGDVNNYTKNAENLEFLGSFNRALRKPEESESYKEGLKDYSEIEKWDLVSRNRYMEDDFGLNDAPSSNLGSLF